MIRRPPRETERQKEKGGYLTQVTHEFREGPSEGAMKMRYSNEKA
jgi:hypothetical protein